jgi:hypothetical protein
VIEHANKDFLFPVGQVDVASSDEELVDQMESEFIQRKVGKRKVGTGEIEVSLEDMVTMIAVRKRIQGVYDGDGGSKVGWIYLEALISLVMDMFHQGR